MRLRRATIDDAEAILHIVERAPNSADVVPARASLADIAAFLRSESAGAHVADDGERDVGAALFNRQGDVFWLFRLAVIESARDRGVGKALVRAVEAGARGDGATAVFVQLAKGSHVQSFFEALGFEVDNEEPDVIAGRPATLVDLVKLV
jgi:N-acetylglutamate synthase-like GNAT family acetyltransferase